MASVPGIELTPKPLFPPQAPNPLPTTPLPTNTTIPQLKPPNVRTYSLTDYVIAGIQRSLPCLRRALGWLNVKGEELWLDSCCLLAGDIVLRPNISILPPQINFRILAAFVSGGVWLMKRISERGSRTCVIPASPRKRFLQVYLSQPKWSCFVCLHDQWCLHSAVSD